MAVFANEVWAIAAIAAATTTIPTFVRVMQCIDEISQIYNRAAR
jgi:hypothetical protein